MEQTDYKELYEQAKERARHKLTYAQVDEIFPELFESEDERISKELIEYIKDQQSSFISAPDCRDKYEEEENNKYNSWIAWLEKRGEQKPVEWSEQDERKCNNIIALVEGKAIMRKAIKGLVNWLKSLRPQPKQSLDEDTQQWIDTIIKDYEDLYDADKDHRATIQAKINILKSLRPQSQWKPSEEQMIAINTAINIIGKGTLNGKQLIELQEQLKKLKEE